MEINPIYEKWTVTWELINIKTNEPVTMKLVYILN